ncbi:PDZ domain-containing protein [Spirillospora sp. CA-294931]|uniref:PDZ domain-containing protein n=1 Tax=Spirillospora sp. CA-294931 TaxID=3240042 RepID=UPI003D90F3B8
MTSTGKNTAPTPLSRPHRRIGRAIGLSGGAALLAVAALAPMTHAATAASAGARTAPRIGAQAGTAVGTVAVARRDLAEQYQIPVLEPGGSAGRVAFPPDGKWWDGTTATITAPKHTRIVDVNFRCVPNACPVTIAPDGRSATVQQYGGTFWQRYDIDLKADKGAPEGRFHGRVSAAQGAQKVTVDIRRQTQGRIAAKYHQTFGRGLKVLSVEPGSSTAASGLKKDDMIVEADGTTVKYKKDLLAALKGKKPGTEVPVTVIRDGDKKTLKVNLDRPA